MHILPKRYATALATVGGREYSRMAITSTSMLESTVVGDRLFGPHFVEAAVC